MFLISSRESLRQNLVQSWTEEAAFLVGKAVFTEAFLSNKNCEEIVRDIASKIARYDVVFN